MEFNESYLKSVLDTKRNLNVISMSQDAYFYQVQMLAHRYDNIKIDIFGGKTSYIKNRENMGHPTLDNPDLIILYSSFIEEDKELETLKDMARKISQEQGKRVTVGYAYIVPWEEREYKKSLHEVKVVSVSGEEEHVETIPTEQYFQPLNLFDVTLQIHDELNNQYKRNRNSSKTAYN